MSVATSKELFINMNPKDIPVWDPKKPYYEQELSTLQFFEEELKKFTYGINIGGYFMPPWLYYHINFFKTPIPVRDNFGNDHEVIMNPPLNDNMFFVSENYQIARKENKMLFLFGSRGVTKSVFISSLEGWTMATRPNGNFSIIGGDAGDLSALSSLMEKNHNDIHPAFYLPTLKKDWEHYVEFGVKEKTGKRLTHGELFIKNADPNKKKSTEKGAGLSPIGFVVDEAGKFDFLKLLQSAIPSFKTPSGWKLVPVLAGTGGNNELSMDARKVLSNPKAYDVLPMNWDLLNDYVPEEYTTWSNSMKKPFGTFFPGQMTYREAIPKVNEKLSTYLGKKSKDLDKIIIKRTDWKLAKEVLEDLIDKNPDPEMRSKNQMYYPRETDDCFLTMGKNPFPAGGIDKHIRRLEEEGKEGKAVEFYKDEGKTKIMFSGKKRADMDYQGGEVDSPCIVYGNVPETPPDKYTFVAGFDDYKVDVAEDSVSHGAYCILKRRQLAINEPCETIQAFYVARPEIHVNLYREIEEIGDIWNAFCLMEAIDTGYIQYLDQKQKSSNVLWPAVSYSQTAKDGKSQLTQRYGMYPTKENKEHLLNLCVDYTKERYTIGIDDEGNEIIKYGYEFIDDIPLLKEMRDYKKGKNADRLTAFGHALVLSREMDNRGIRPKSQQKKFDLEEFGNSNKPKKPKVKLNTYATNTKLKKY